MGVARVAIRNYKLLSNFNVTKRKESQRLFKTCLISSGWYLTVCWRNSREKCILLQINSFLMLLAHFLRKKRRGDKSPIRSLLLLKGIFDRKSNLDFFIKLIKYFALYDFVFRRIVSGQYSFKSRKRLRVLEKIVLVGKGTF